MAKRVFIQREFLNEAEPESPPAHLDADQMGRLAAAFDAWFADSPSDFIRRVRGRYRIAFLFLRFTGARIGEILNIDDMEDIDFHHSELTISPQGDRNERQGGRVVPLPTAVTLQLLGYLGEYPYMRGKVFALDQGNFRREFYRRAEEALIPRELSHPHILRHTRAVELLRAGVPLPVVRDILGHTLSSTTAVYVRRTEITVTRLVLRDKGLL